MYSAIKDIYASAYYRKLRSLCQTQGQSTHNHEVLAQHDLNRELTCSL